MLSKSKSKQKYSFSKAQRFPSNKLYLFYKPSTTLQHSHLSHSNLSTSSLSKSYSQDLCSFGSSTRTLFKNSICSPSPKYNIKSGFQINLMEKKGTKLSSSRNSVDNSNFAYIKKNSNPGPGQYEPQKPKTKKKIVIGMKTKNTQSPFLNDKLIQDNPPPNKYHVELKLPSTGKIVTSSTRFKQSKENIPGPGHYEMETNYDRERWIKKSIVDKAERKHEFDKKVGSPGPGSYKIYSEFD